MCVKRRFGIIIFKITSIINMVVKEIPVDYQVIQPYAISIVVITEEVKFFVSVIKSATCICLGIYPLSIASCSCSIKTQSLIFFHPDIDDTGVAGSIILSRGIGDNI